MQPQLLKMMYETNDSNSEEIMVPNVAATAEDEATPDNEADK